MDSHEDPGGRAHGGAHDDRKDRRCATCGWPLRDPYEVVSRHPVTEGVVVYSRCACGVLRVWLQRSRGADRLVVGARSTLPGEAG